MIELQNIPISLSPEQSIRDAFITNHLREKMMTMTQADFSSIEVRMAAMCDPIHILQRLNKKKAAALCYGGSVKRKEKSDNLAKQGLCICPRDMVIHQGCKCGGE